MKAQRGREFKSSNVWIMHGEGRRGKQEYQMEQNIVSKVSFILFIYIFI